MAPRQKLVLSKEAMDLLFHAINSHEGVQALKKGFETLVEQREKTSERNLFGVGSLHGEIMSELINTQDVEE